MWRLQPITANSPNAGDEGHRSHADKWSLTRVILRLAKKQLSSIQTFVGIDSGAPKAALGNICKTLCGILPRQTDMKIFLTDQTSKFSRHLSDLKSTPVMPYEKKLLTEKISSVSLDLDFSHADLEPFFNYEIFPSNILTFRTQWQEEHRQMKVGDTILQQVYLPPFPTISQKIIFGVRIYDIIENADKKGFSYETLAGHVEKGISTFTIERTGDTCSFKIHTFSQPGNLLTKLLGPIFSVPYQTYCTKAALNNVKGRMEGKTTA